MHKNISSHKKFRKFKILLDSAFAKPEAFPKLNKRANLAHAFYDCGLPRQAEDEEIYNKAIEEDRFVLTVNFKDFRNLVKKGKPGIFGVETQLSTIDMDNCVCQFLSGKNPEDFIGKAVRIPYQNGI